MVNERPSTNIKRKLINLHIIGAQKCGTSALAHFLQQHDDIYVVDGKEAHIFDSPTFLHSKEKMQVAHHAYSKRLSTYKNEQYICDATPITWTDKRFLRHCYAYNKTAKFIVILRNPAERAFSQYLMSKQREQEDKSFLYAILNEKSRLKAHKEDLRFTSPWRHQSYLQRGRYSQQLSTLFSIVPANQVLILQQEALRQNHALVLEDIFKFLGLPNQHIPAEQIFTGQVQQPNIIDAVGKLYAKLYYFIRGENKHTWSKIIERAKENVDAQN